MEVEIDAGPHSGLVHEVIDFVLGGGVLASTFEPLSSKDEFLVIKSLDDIDLYWEPHFDGARIIGDRNWTDIKRSDGERFQIDDLPNKQMSEIVRLRKRLSPFFEETSRRLYEALELRLKGVLPESEIGEIWGDFDNFVFVRAIRGLLPSSFNERLFSIYRAGGYPCGWEGQFPAGRLVVFSR